MSWLPHRSPLNLMSIVRESRMLARTSLLLAVMILIAACERGGMHPENVLPATVEAAIGAATSVELVSLEPDGSSITPNATAPLLRGFEVLGSTTLSTPQAASAFASLRSGMAGWDGRTSVCVFRPRHALVITTATGSIDILVCFECGDITVYESGSEQHLFVALERSADFDALLTTAGVQLATPAR